MESIATQNRVTRGRALRLVLAAAGIVACGAVLLHAEPTMEGAHAATLVLLVGAAAVTDLRGGTIPNGLNALGVLSGLAFAIGGGAVAPVVALQGGLAAGLVLLGVRGFGYLVAKQPGMGYGDVKLAVVLGLFLGWGSLWALYLGVVAAGLFGIAGIVTGAIDRRQRIPFAPFIAAGVVLHLFVVPPEHLLSWL